MVGAGALLVDGLDAGQVTAFARRLRSLSGGDWTAREVVPGATTVLVDGIDGFEPGALAAEIAGWDLAPVPADDGPVVTVPVVFDGPDLEDVARLWDVSSDEVVARLLATEQRVAFSGFAPGFAYLAGLPAAWRVPRRESPRTRVPAGALGLAGTYAGIYPRASPGGWQLVGRAVDAVLWDERRDPPALLAPGTRVRFVEASGARDRAELADEPDDGGENRAETASGLSSSPVSSGRAGGGSAIEVVRAGALTTVQDQGRGGHAHLGVPRSGAADAPAAARANALVGNDPDIAVLESTLDGCALRVGGSAVVAVTGARAPVWVGDVPAPHGAPIRLAAGQLLEVGAAADGLRTYVAIRGGIAVEPVLGSRSTDVLSGLGPEPLRDGASVPTGPAPPLDDDAFAALRSIAVSGSDADRASATAVELDFTWGPREEWFAAEARRTLTGSAYTVTGDSNRVGVRLAGEPLARAREDELPSEGMVLGAIQVPPSGMPVIFLADHPTTGGYPAIGVLTQESVARAAQLRPGEAVTFAPRPGRL